MTTGARILLVVIVGGTLMAAATVAVAAAAIYGSGTIAVEVAEPQGSNLSVRVPAGLADLALRLIPDPIVEKALDEAGQELADVWPGLRDSWDAFLEAPDFVLVDVQSGADHVRVYKHGGRLVVDVDTDGKAVNVTLPLRTLHKIVKRVEEHRPGV